MLTARDSFNDEPVPPECRATVARIQGALDGDADTLAADAHATACAACRERVRAARVLLSVLATPAEPTAVPPGFADRVLSQMWAERHVRTRRRSYAAVVGALAASVLLIAGLSWFFSSPHDDLRPRPDLPVLPQAKRPDIAPAPREKEPTPAPEPRPIRFGDAVANTGQAIMDTPRPFAESVAVAPKVFDVLSSPFRLPAPPADPMAHALEPARKSLAELPVAARAGLEPVTGTAEKAFARFLRDVGSVKPNS